MFHDTDRRMHVRFDINEYFVDTTWWYQKSRIIATLLNKHYTCLIKDISEGGLSFITNDKPDMGSFVGVSVGYGEYAHFPLTGRVRHIEKLGEDTINGELKTVYRVSIQYLYCTDRSMDYLRRLLDRLKATHYETA